MRTRRRRLFREEVVAPWVTLIVIVGLWWAGSRLISPEETGTVPAPADAVDAGDAGAAGGAAGGGAAGGGAAVSVARSDAQRTAAPEEIAAAADDAAPADRDDVLTEMAGEEATMPGRPIVPVAGVEASTLRSTFNDARGGGSRRHEAMDILAPRGTPVVASVAGRIVKLFTSAAGGLTIYQFDAAERYCYYYAHLDSYAANLTEGQVVAAGQVIGYVGTTGNAPPDTPHLHFAIFRLDADKRWWQGEALDPITFLR
jgi:murein DD-endopeptidase MepM/ murein hydrolase activator NlpD